MIITRDYARKLVRDGKATIEGRTTDQPSWDRRYDGKTYDIITRHDLQRVDHCQTTD